MKVLSLKEPFASLILNNRKHIETRSWKTNYRGELYIHASMTKMNKKDINLLKDKPFNYGYIICKCNLVDCIYMTKEYVKKMEKSSEFIYGDYSEGRYAWVLENIVPLKIPIKAKGQLNIWNFYNEFEIMNLMNNINYGWLDKNNKYYWFEHSWEQFKGIHEYNSLNNLLNDVKEKFIKFQLNKNDKNLIILKEYKKPKYHISSQEFINHCKNN